MRIVQKSLALLLSYSLLLAAGPGGFAYASQTDQPTAQPGVPANQTPG
jgi:hypothetical protein